MSSSGGIRKTTLGQQAPGMLGVLPNLREIWQSDLEYPEERGFAPEAADDEDDAGLSALIRFLSASG